MRAKAAGKQDYLLFCPAEAQLPDHQAHLRQAAAAAAWRGNGDGAKCSTTQHDENTTGCNLRLARALKEEPHGSWGHAPPGNAGGRADERRRASAAVGNADARAPSRPVRAEALHGIR